MTVIAAVTNGNYTHYLDISLVSQNVSANTSLVSYNYYITRNVAAGSGAFAGAPGRSFNATIDGSPDTRTVAFDFRTSATISFVSGTYTVTHASDGTHTVTGSFSGPGSFVSSGFPSTSGSGSLVLPTIARASIPTFSANPVDAGTSVTITTNRSDATFTHEVDFSFGTQSGTIATGVGASTAWTPPLSLLNEIPNTTSGSATITVKTYDASSNLIGTTNTNLTINAGAAIVPTIGSVSVAEATTSPNVATLVGGFVQGVSKFAVAIVSGAGAYGSTIVSNSIAVGSSQVISAASGTSTVVNDTGTVAVIGTVTDSRGRTTSVTHNVTVLAYAKPTVTTATSKRALVSGTLDPNGTYMSVNIVAGVQSLVVGSQKNNLTYSVKKQPRGGTTAWSSITPDSGPTSAGSTGLSTTFVLGTYSVSSSYDVRVEVTDVLGNTTAILTTLPTGGVLMHMSNTFDGIGIGKYWSISDASIDANGKIYQNNGNLVIDVTNLATTATAGILKLSTDAQAIAGTDTATAVTPHALAAAIAPQIASVRGRKDLIINGSFRINQRAYVSGTALTLNSYGFDRWKASTASTTCTFTAAPQGQQITLNSGGSIMQVIERANVLAGTYTLSWTGTATARVYNSGATAPSYAASPITVTLDGLQNVNVEFAAVSATKTVSQIQLEAGTVPTAYEVLTYGEELAQCQRYFWIVAANNSTDQTRFAVGWQTTTTVGEAAMVVPVPLRATPTIAFANVGWGDGASFHSAITGLTLYQTPWSPTSTLYQLNAVYAAAGAAFRPGTISAFNATAAFISLSAEL